MATKTNLTGKKIGRLIVLSEVFGHKHAGKHRKWLCLCDCGNKREIFQDRLVKGKTVSCGCWQREVTSLRTTTHGRSKTPLYKTWSAMIARCSNNKLPTWADYGGRGISVCDRWLTFENFLADMGDRPFVGAEIDRVNNDGNYEPSNCRWATRLEQCSNTRANILITIDGRTQNLMQWAIDTGIAYKTLHNRLKAGKAGRELIAAPRLKRRLK